MWACRNGCEIRSPILYYVNFVHLDDCEAEMTAKNKKAVKKSVKTTVKAKAKTKPVAKAIKKLVKMKTVKVAKAPMKAKSAPKKPVKMAPAKKPAAKVAPKAPAAKVAVKAVAKPAAVVAISTKVVARPVPAPVAAAPRVVVPAAKAPMVHHRPGMSPMQARALAIRPANDTPVDFRSGDYVVYPAHGVGTIEGVETQTTAGMTATFYFIGPEQ